MANIVIEFAWMDGKGGQLGAAEYPPYSKVENWNRTIIMDAYDVNGESEMDPVQIIGHKFGHGVGMKHSRDLEGVMYSFYRPEQWLVLDDIFGAKMHYDVKKKFWHDGRGYIPIKRNDEMMSENFRTSEFLSACTDFSYDFQFLDETLIAAIQIILYYYVQPILIISSYRDSDCNTNAGGAIKSRHLQAQTLDWKFVGPGWQRVREEFKHDINTQEVSFPIIDQ